MLHIRQAIVVEGKYDKIKLLSVTDAQIISLDGFSVFSDGEKLDFLRKVAAARGVIILTDPDAAGFKLRAFIGGSLPVNQVSHAYVPDIFGKEKRKESPGKEGKLGVEGIPSETLEKILAPFATDIPRPGLGLTKADFFGDGLSGTPRSADKRRAFAAAAGLPTRISANALLEYVNLMYTMQQYNDVLRTIEQTDDN